MNQNDVAIEINNDPLLTPKQAAEYLSLATPNTLANWRKDNRYPELAPVYIGKRVRYRKSVLDAFLSNLPNHK